jgi:hypothetical protein
MRKRFYFTFALLAAVMAAAFFYQRLGGFNDIELGTADLPGLHVAGRAHAGFSTDPAVHDLLRDMDQRRRSGQLQGELAVVYYGNPDQEADSIRIFVGVASTDSSAIPDGLAYIFLPGGKAVQASINAYSVAAPNPDEVNARLKEYARGQGIDLKEVYLERYTSESRIVNAIYAQ